MIKNLFDKFNSFNAHLIYFFCIFIAVDINIYFYHRATLVDVIEILGTFVQIALPCYVLVPIVVKKDYEAAKQMLLLLTIVLILTYILKFTIPAKRPFGGSMSFPSGHTVGAFSGAVFLTLRYGKTYALYTMPLAFFVAFSRVYTNNHWPSDVAASIILCFTVGLFMVRKFDLDDRSRGRSSGDAAG